MGITAAAMPIVWVAVGGRKDLTATLIGTLAVLWVFQTLSIYGSQYALVVMGALLVATVLFAPEGLVPALVKAGGGGVPQIGRTSCRERRCSTCRSRGWPNH